MAVKIVQWWLDGSLHVAKAEKDIATLMQDGWDIKASGSAYDSDASDTKCWLLMVKPQRGERSLVIETGS